MQTTSVTVQVPAHLSLSAFEVGMLVATRLYDEGKVSSGQAAEMVGLSKCAFIELLGKYGVSVFGYDFQDIQNDLKNV